jgi:hypothetical protein
MKRIYVLIIFILGLTLTNCGEPVIPGAFSVELPTLPVLWQELLGPCHWRLIWLNPEGIQESLETDGKGAIAITAVREWATPVLAFPFWPDRGLLPGELRPAGGILPFDTQGTRLRLSWQAGPEAWFYRELAQAVLAAPAAETAGTKRRPEYFDWPRFRELLGSSAVPPEIRTDPWRADWHDIAVRTVKSGFDRRRILIQAQEELLIPQDALTPGGLRANSAGTGFPLAGPSPLAKPLFPESGTGFRFALGNQTDTYVSSQGILRISRGGWMWEHRK